MNDNTNKELPEGYVVDPNKIRQGDIYVNMNRQEQPEGAQRKDKTIALGEVTGHHHSFVETVDVELFGELGGNQWVVAEEYAPLTHQEHDTLIVSPGISKTHVQREYSPEGIRNVRD